jgi:hypothetical protein
MNMAKVNISHTTAVIKCTTNKCIVNILCVAFSPRYLTNAVYKTYMINGKLIALHSIRASSRVLTKSNVVMSYVNSVIGYLLTT